MNLKRLFYGIVLSTLCIQALGQEANAIRDTMMGDLVSGISRLGEVLLSAVSLAVGAGVVFAAYITLGGTVM